jgi:TIR domain
MVLVFISHSESDARIAEFLVDLLRSALDLSASEVRATSVEGYRLPAGADTDEQLRDELLTAPAFVGLVSPKSFSSAYVLFELGARWGAKKHLVPLLAPGVDASILRGPIANLNALRCDVAAQLHQLVHDLADLLGRSPEPPAVYQRKVDALLAYRAPEPSAADMERSRPQPSSTAVAGDQYADADAVINKHCEKEWPKDFNMRAYCVRQQREAVTSLKRGGPLDIPPDVFAEIRAACASQWPEDFNMRLYCEKQQIGAYLELKGNS